MWRWVPNIATKSDSKSKAVCIDELATNSGNGCGSGPASSNSTLRLGSSDNRDAATHPADPPPTMITSYFSSAITLLLTETLVLYCREHKNPCLSPFLILNF